MRRHLPLALAALTLAASALAAPVASAHQGNPNMESIISSVTPATPGVKLQVLNRDDRFELTNRSHKDILLFGYSGEQYARIMADGTVEQNVNSPAYYLNGERDANVTVPASASAKAPPKWETLDRTGSFQWHDHRMHYMGTGVPPSVKDTKLRQKVQDYTIPIKVGATTGAIKGSYWWAPPKDGGAPVGAIVAFVIVLIAGAAAVVVTRRRRGAGRPDDDSDDDDNGGGGTGDGTPPRAPVEAW
ncbi:MAG TPA: hypothetical protein VI318_06085 [Baekduia sp.]